VDHRSDIFSFGTLLYEMATGRAPFRGPTTADTIAAILKEPHPSPSDLDPDLPAVLVTVIDRALAKNPAGRYQSIDELKVDLQRVAQPQDLPSSAASETPPRPPWFMRRRLAAVGAVVLLIAVVIAATYRGVGRSEGMNAIAVLPFSPAKDAGEHEYLIDGLTDGVIARLSELPATRVIARSTASVYQGRAIDPRAIGRELGVGAIVMGDVAAQDDGFVIRVELVDVKTGSRLWGGEYHRPMSGLAAIPAEVAIGVSREMRMGLTGEQQRRVSRDYTRNAAAYQSYLKGRYFWNKRTHEAYNKAIEHFTSAIEHDPMFALAYSGLADTYLMLRGYGLRSPEQTIPYAQAAAERALAIDDTLAEAHTSLGQLRTFVQDWNGADAAFTRAIALNPNYATAHHWQAMYLAVVGRLDEALQAITRAQTLDPLSLVINTEVGRLLYFARRYDDAIAQHSKTLEMDNTFGLTHLHLGMALVEKGSYPEAITEFHKAQSLGAPIVTVGLVRAYALAGKRREAQDLFRNLVEKSDGQFLPPYAMALAYTSLGDHERAIDSLEEGASAGGAWFLKVNPPWDVLRSNPRFQAALQRAGLAP
jgi:serine/threonine-protein kinase